MLKKFLQQSSTKYIAMKQIYYFLHQNGSTTKANLVEQLKMKQTTVNRHLEQLLKDQIIQIGQYEASSGGRPPSLFEVNPEAGFIIGIDLSRTKTTLTLVNSKFDDVDHYSFMMTEQHTPAHTISILAKQIKHLLDKHQISSDMVLGIGIGTVGPIDRIEGMILEPDAFIAEGWHHIPLVKELKEKVNIDTIRIENGANLAALMSGHNCRDTILYCISGRGLRCGVVSNGSMIHNKTGDASSFGEMILDLHYGTSLASLISYDYLLKDVNRRYQEQHSRKFLDFENKKDAMDQLLTALQQGDAIVQEAVSDSAFMYGIGIANMVNVLHPDKVVLNSELTIHYQPYYQKIVETAKQHIKRIEREPVSFTMEQQRDQIISLGACALVFQGYFS
ncbi:ROK family transcriptional regulator [Gracilibacillus caseinilyticus]|uniref:ROK family transcriptional regulator n=1 Tax=Gracilibacillus caseinilyticus TaxID=2932256 RepID=A0ABY4EQJ8_9BACI|nr:ROK family transcriptional regulator [Gracilibacillus caseinilyticus]UOQ46731.1 ROK family transcriptional regulator [Gracilibacillus caseinilyticus]